MVLVRGLAILAWKQGEYDHAGALLEECLTHYERLGVEASQASTCTQLGGVRLYQGRREEALPLLARGLQLYRKLGSPSGLAFSLEVTAAAAASIGEAQRAALLIGRVDALRDELGEWELRVTGDPYERAVVTATDALGHDGFEAAYSEGRAMTLDEAVEYALESLVLPAATMVGSCGELEWGIALGLVEAVE